MQGQHDCMYVVSILLTHRIFIMLQTLSSLALVFALHHYKPTPLYVMDEIDAALGKPVASEMNFQELCFYKWVKLNVWLL